MYLPGVERARLLTLLVHAEPLSDAHRVLQVLYPLHFVLRYASNFLTDFMVQPCNVRCLGGFKTQLKKINPRFFYRCS
jgi:hypothetical protein